MAPESWQLKRGDTHVGTLVLDQIDMFWTDCHFAPGPGWDEVSPLFAALKVAWQHGGTHEPVQADQGIAAQQMVLVPDDGSEPTAGMLLRIREDRARFRG